jgi:hypothetical protein
VKQESGTARLEAIVTTYRAALEESLKSTSHNY